MWKSGLTHACYSAREGVEGLMSSAKSNAKEGNITARGESYNNYIRGPRGSNKVALGEKRNPR